MFKKIKNLIRNFKHWMAYQPPGALTLEGWNSFNKEYKKNAPIRHWITRDLHRKFVLPVKWKYENITDFVRYRTYDRYHIIKTGRKPGYQDPDSNMLHVTFYILRDFVECELAWNTFVSNTDKYKHMRYFWVYTKFSTARHWFRSPELGLAHLEWETTLDDVSLPPHERSEDQASAAREILLLYTWWTQQRPNRKEIELVSFRENSGADLDHMWDVPDRNSEKYKKFQDSVEKRNLQDEKFTLEDTNMLVRLVKIRSRLWS